MRRTEYGYKIKDVNTDNGGSYSSRQVEKWSKIARREAQAAKEAATSE